MHLQSFYKQDLEGNMSCNSIRFEQSYEWGEAPSVRSDNQSNKALLASSGTSSCGQCPAFKFTRDVFGQNSLIRLAFAGPTHGSKSPHSNYSGQESSLKTPSKVYLLWFNKNLVINLWTPMRKQNKINVSRIWYRKKTLFRPC